MRRVFLSLILTCFAVLGVSASKALSIQQQLTLADGRTVMARFYGDENVSYYLTSDNEMILMSSDGLHTASAAERDSIGRLCRQIDESNSKALSRLLDNNAAINSATEGGKEALVWAHICPSKGNVRIPVIMIDFSDGVTFSFTNEEINDYFNSEEVHPTSPYSKYKNYYSYGSIGAFFKNCSGGAFTPQFDLYGPYRVSKKSTDYPNNADISSTVREAIQMADADIDFSQYDFDNDGYIDDLFIFYAGYASNTGDPSTANTIWPKSGVIYDGKAYDGKIAYRYCASNEIALTPEWTNAFGGPRMSTGNACHEFCHTLGLPDLYPTQYSGWSNKDFDNQSMEDWSLMDNGGWGRYVSFAPTPLSAWERAIFGWTEPIQDLKRREDITLSPLDNGGKALKVPTSSPDEYFILENLPPTTGWYRGLCNNGMLINHVVWDRNSVYYNSVNNVKGKPKFTILPADNYLTSSWNQSNPVEAKTYDECLAGDTYPGSHNVKEFSNYKAYCETINKPITDIMLNADNTVSFKFMGGTLMGDANADGKVSIADANLVVNYFLGTVTELDKKAADINRDGAITISDANDIVNIFLNGGTE